MPNVNKPTRYRTEYIRKRSRITPALITAGVVVVVAMVGLFLVLMNL